MRLAWILLYCCGLRRGELLHLRLADVDMEQGVLADQLKQNFTKPDWCLFRHQVREELRRYLRQRRRQKFPDGCFPHHCCGMAARGTRVEPISPATLTSNWVCACQSASVFSHHGRTPRIHDLRHSFAVEALRQGYRRGSEPQPRCRGSHLSGACLSRLYSSLFEVHRTAAHRRQPNDSIAVGGCLAVFTRAPASIRQEVVA